MADRDEENVRLAYLTLVLRGEQVDATRLAAEVLKIDSMLDYDSLAMKVQRAAKFRAVVGKVEFEQTSQRYVLIYTARNGEDGEQIRSERIDGVHGNAVVSMFQGLVPGDEVIIYKLNEESNDTRLPHGYRVAPYVVKLGNNTVR